MSGVRVGFAPHFIGDAVTAFVTFLPVPCVAGQLATGLLLVKLKGDKKDSISALFIIIYIVLFNLYLTMNIPMEIQ